MTHQPLLERLGLAPSAAPEPSREELAARRAELLELVNAGAQTAADLAAVRRERNEARTEALARVDARFAPRIAKLERAAAERDAARRELEQVEVQLRASADPALRVAESWLHDVRLHLRGHGRGVVDGPRLDRMIEELRARGIEPGLRYDRLGRVSQDARLLEQLLEDQERERRADEKCADVEAWLERLAEAVLDPGLDTVAFLRELVEAVGRECPACNAGLPAFGS